MLFLIATLSNYFNTFANTDTDSDIRDQNTRKSFNIILIPLMNIYKSIRLCPLILLRVTKCLISLTCSDIDKNNRTKLLQEEVLFNITQYLEYPDEKIVFLNLKLFANILPETRDNLNELLQKNNKLLSKLVNVLSGTNIAKTHYGSSVSFYYIL